MTAASQPEKSRRAWLFLSADSRKFVTRLVRFHATRSGFSLAGCWELPFKERTFY